MYAISHGAVSFFITAILTISLIQWFKWNAAPILSVSFWALPAAVFVSLLGLVGSIWLIGKVEQLNWFARLSLALTPLRTKLEPLKKEM